MLDSMRRNMKVVLWITVAAFVLLIFLVWGAETQLGCGGGGPARGIVGRVNGQAITIDYFNRVYQSSRDQFRQSRGSDPGPGDEAQLQQQAWDGIVEQTILTQEAKKHGLIATDEEIVHEARSNPPPMLMQNPNFQTNGKFDQQKYLAFLDNPQVAQQMPTFYTELESYLREMLPIDKLTAMVYAGAVVSDSDVKQAFKDRNEQARITYRLFDLRKYTVAQPATDAEAEAYFKAHPDEFNLPPQATIHYTRVERKPTDADMAALRQQVADYAAIARRYAQGDTTALNFPALAETYSELPSGTKGGLNDHFYAKGELTPEMESAVFSLPPGGISDPIQDRSGFHLVQVDSVMTEGDAKKVRIREILIKIEPSDATVSDLEQKITDLKEQADKGKFDAAVQRAGLQVTTPPAFPANGMIRGMETVPGAVQWAFRAKPGEVSPTFTTNDAWYLAQFVSKSGDKPTYRDVADLAKQKATEAKQRDMAAKDAQAFLDRVKNAPSWKLAAGADSQEVRTVGPFSRASGVPGIGREPDALAAVFSMSAGQTSAPVNVTRGVMIFRVEERIPANDAQFATQKDQLLQQLVSQRRTELYQDWLKDLKDRAQIDDFRNQVFKS